MTAEIRSWYPILVVSGALLTLSMHGALWMVLKTDSSSRERVIRLVDLTWWGVLTATVAVAATSFLLSPHLAERLATAPWGYVFPVVALAGLFGIRISRTPDMDFLAYFFSCTYLAGAFASALFIALPHPVL